MRTLREFRRFPFSVQLLLFNQLTINVGFYMLMPYLADHLSTELALSAWLVGLVLGVRNFSQQGMFVVGGALADRFGFKPLMVAGCTLRTGAFALLGLVDTLPAVIIASAATGFAGALFNPALRAYLAHDSGERRVQAFALFNVFYQTGILLGPLLGLALSGAGFRTTCLVAAGVFALLTVLQVRALPQRRGDGPRRPGPGHWRRLLGHRPLLLFSVVMIGSYVMSFQVYLALPLEARRLAGDGPLGTAAVAVMFAVSGLVTILGQVRLTAWCRRRLPPGRSISAGLTVMALGFVAPIAVARVGPGPWLPLGALVVTAALLAVGNAVVFPFEMDTIVGLAGNRAVAVHYGLYSTISGVGIMVGNLGTGAALDTARAVGLPELPWLALLGVGLACALGIRALDRRGLISTGPPTPAPPATAGTTGGERAEHRPAVPR